MNFFILFVFGYQFAPRYRDLHKRMTSLIGFHHPSHYADYLIKPARKTLEGLIVKEWPNIQRILASLAQKDVKDLIAANRALRVRAPLSRVASIWARKSITRCLAPCTRIRV